MIFGIHYALIMAGYASCGLLLGRYMMLYGGADKFELSLVFMIHPLSMFLRPLVSAQADRFQVHKKLLCLSVFVNSISYLPMAILPILLRHPTFGQILTQRFCFWTIVVGHTFGSLSFCGVRSLGDSLAVNYAKRSGTNFAEYRKFGSISFGVCNYLLGFINQDSILPDFTPAAITNVLAMAILSALIYFWSDDYFVMMTSEQQDALSNRPTSNILENIQQSCASSRNDQKHQRHHKENSNDSRGDMDISLPDDKQNKTMRASDVGPIVARLNGMAAVQPRSRQLPAKRVSALQQLRIFFLLVKRDYRIPMFLLLLFYGGLVGYASPNFVFTYMNLFCSESGNCNGAYLSGLTMISYCLVETLFYMIIKAANDKISHAIKLSITLASLTVHYCLFGFLLPNVSPYIFLVESLHGLEYSISISSSVELGYKFANEIELVMPELRREGIVKLDDDPEMIKKSLLATMNACFTLVYEGLGTITGVFIYGLIIDKYSFTAAFKLIGFLSMFGFVTVLVVITIGRYLNIKPQILQNQGQLDRREEMS